jgi:hypothetical protein
VPWVVSNAYDPTGRGHTGSYTLTVGANNDPDNDQSRTTMRLGTANAALTLDQEYSLEFALEHREDAEYVKVSLQENRVYEVFLQNLRESAATVVVPNTSRMCRTNDHHVFYTPDEFDSSADYKDYIVKLTAGYSGAGTGTVTIKLISDNPQEFMSNLTANGKRRQDLCN